jgi:tRNA threonylcarbamoyl adenosine modification protein YjeE
MIYKIPLDTILDTKKIAKILSELLPQKGVITFSGKMGSGKTTFISNIIEEIFCQYHLDVPIITSPTFSIVNEYDLKLFQIAHFDLFRLQNPDELINLGFDDYQNNALCFIEWAENAFQYLDKPLLKCHLEVSNDKRLLTLNPCTDYSLDNKIINQYKL